MRAWWSVLFVPQSRTHLHRSCDCSLLCLEEPITNSASGPPFSLSLRISSSFLEMSSSAWPSIENGSCEATAAPPTPTPERLRNVRRSIVLTSTPESPRERRPCGAAVLVALRVSSMAVSSDLGRAVVVVHVLALLIAARSTLVFGRRSRLGGRRFGRHDCCRSR